MEPMKAVTHFKMSIRLASLWFLVCTMGGITGAAIADEKETPLAPRIPAFQAGEALTYDVAWSNVVKAGTVVMEVKQETMLNRKDLLRFSVTSHTTGVVGKLYPLGDTVQSVFDPQIMQSLSYSLKAVHGERIRRREMFFDHDRKKVVSFVNEDPQETFDIPDQVQDSLSALYYLRTRDDFAIDTTITFDVCDRGKSFPVDVQILGREKIKTPAGEFATIKVRARKGIFLSDGELFIWFTDDIRKIPVLMKSTLKVGSFEFTLTDMKQGNAAP